MIKEVWLALKEAIGMVFDAVYTPTSIYISGLQKLIRSSVITTLALLGISILFALFSIYWPLKLSIIIIGFIFTALLIAAFPILTLASVAHEKVPAIKRVVQLYAAIVFWILQVMIYFSIVPVQNAPAVIPLVLLLFAAIAFGFVAYGFKEGVSPKWAMIRTVVILCLVTFFFFFPQTHEYINLGAEKINKEITIGFKAPRIIEYRPGLTFFDTVWGKPRIWFYKRGDGGFDLFDRPGFHPGTGEKLQPVTPETESQILEWQKSRQQPPVVKIPDKRPEEPQPEPFPSPPVETQGSSKISVPESQSTPIEETVPEPLQPPVEPVKEERPLQIEPANIIIIPKGTAISVRLTETISTEYSRAGGQFVAHLNKPLIYNKVLIAEKNSQAVGLIMYLEKGGEEKGPPFLSLQLHQITRPNGKLVNITSNGLNFKGKASAKSKAAKIIGGAAVGALVGTLASEDKRKAALGAVAGGIAGTGVAMAGQDKPVKLLSERVLEFRLAKPLTLDLSR